MGTTDSAPVPVMTPNARRWYAAHLAEAIYFKRWTDPRPRVPLKPPKQKGLHQGRGFVPLVLRVDAPAHDRTMTPSATITLGLHNYNAAMMAMTAGQRQEWLDYITPRYHQLLRVVLPPPALFVSAGLRIDPGNAASRNTQQAALVVLEHATIQVMSTPQESTLLTD